MVEPFHRKILRRITDLLLWDTSATPTQGTWEWLSAKWRPIVAFAASALLTWQEWAKNHPPEIVLIAFIHFLFVLVVLAFVFHIARGITREIRQSSSKQNG